ncbi:SDR family NAD(P)-dependent oxidoreductase [Sporomusa acidovorans]|uniref:Glucose 1-dehydrogenase 1 n=1 Tax=Sporomusa acidovorans (strain ATCC 49682 / DSM 3132 / Mol) TaxID=1123286 RepID=A0ABZ3IZV9_SPOA4|nr:SDR family oxidoreductase [Sporomusa acidovorans]OZC21370.1 glucose 1-dehydrogenase 1 [Sporomusa acidovorans DSM 3132]SDE56068.1 3-oxoacyl-[acyl-carrier protein] reductase [Sporomusa acidovorans]
MDNPSKGNWVNTVPLKGQVAVVTGGGTGIGRGIAETFAAAGAKVVVAGRREEKLAEVCEAIKATGGEALGVRTDVTVQADIDNLMEQACKMFGTVNILVNNSGMALPRCNTLNVAREDWEKLFALNMTSAFFVSQAAAKVMAKNGGGRIVNMTSQRGISALPGIVPYCTAKGALMSMTKALAIDLAPNNINVNAVAPGYVHTDMVAGLLADPDRLQSVLDRTPLRKMGTVDEMAAAVLYLVIPQSSYTTGQTLILDGGWSSQ